MGAAETYVSYIVRPGDQDGFVCNSALGRPASGDSPAVLSGSARRILMVRASQVPQKRKSSEASGGGHRP